MFVQHVQLSTINIVWPVIIRVALSVWQISLWFRMSKNLASVLLIVIWILLIVLVNYVHKNTGFTVLNVMFLNVLSVNQLLLYLLINNHVSVLLLFKAAHVFLARLSMVMAVLRVTQLNVKLASQTTNFSQVTILHAKVVNSTLDQIVLIVTIQNVCLVQVDSWSLWQMVLAIVQLQEIIY